MDRHMDGHLNCERCGDELLHCHEVSVEHADGTTECLDRGCDLPHVAHEWQLSCAVLAPPCPCIPSEQIPPLFVPDLVAA